ncbi:penicillin-binding protein 1A [Rhodomicrobium sp. Az07]|uniref:penicillin-binding protein 1A n=1 Tax=Rhodomicrobium sp. Az07 TaxID=2839034 RepID=UPI002036B760|nr:penicillin-binding protein 1A [Rhodomicrobium sp. Az07]
MFIAASAGAAYFLWTITQDLPDYDKLANYKPPIITRVHAGDGRLIAEFAKERRIYVPVQVMPKPLINAFLAAEDQSFWEHGGLDFRGILRAVYNNLTKNRKEGASTITQQVAKNFLLTSERSYLRKAKEAILAIRIERAYTKERILDLYLNQIYLGGGTYGVAAAALRYFGKELNDLQLHEVAYLAALPKEPTKLQLTTARPGSKAFKDALLRRNDILNNMVRFGFIKQEDAEEAKKQPLEMVARTVGPSTFAAEYFAEEVRRTLADMYGLEDNDDNSSVYAGGYSVRSTLDPSLQMMARSALRAGLVSFDRKRGWRGPITKIDLALAGDWGVKLAEVPALSDVEPWRLGVVLQTAKDKAVIGLQPGRMPNNALEAERETVELGKDGVKWALDKLKVKTKGPIGVSDILSLGDVVYVSPPNEIDLMKERERNPKLAAGKTLLPAWSLMQVPQVGGATVVMDPHTGRVLALIGGFSFAESQFNRALQARRQPGSSFKPIVYAAALDNGYTPASVVNDAAFSIDQGNGQGEWKPSNYDKQVHGLQPLRIGIEKSRNLMTVRLAQDLGMPIVSEYARRFGVYEDLPPLLSMALGAGETSLIRLTTAYCMFANGGKKINYTFIDRIQNRMGQTIWRHDNRPCESCNAEAWRGQAEPQLTDERAQIIDPITAYQVTSMLEGVVVRGTGSMVWKRVQKPLGGKTGTTNDEKDAWFIGFSPDIAMGVFIGYDSPQPMGHGETGGELAAPIFADFFKMALKDKPAVPFRTPADIRQVRVNKRTGQRTDPADPDAITEYFKPGTEPPEGYATASASYPVAGDQQQDYSQQGGYPGDNNGGWRQPPQPSSGGWGQPQPTPPNQQGTVGGYPPPYGRTAPSPGGLY